MPARLLRERQHSETAFYSADDKCLKPFPISLDNYFVDREETPLDENGNYDYESLYALDLELFNQQLQALLRGEEVELPRFNFSLGKKEYKGDKLK